MPDLIYDDAGKAWLAGELPKKAIPLPKGTFLDGAIDHYPYSDICYLAIVEGKEELEKAILWSVKRETIKRYGGIPIIGVNDDKERGKLISVNYGKLTVFASKLLKWASTELWGVKIEHGGW